MLNSVYFQHICSNSDKIEAKTKDRTVGYTVSKLATDLGVSHN